ncbi:MAG: Uma2 family endonuclease [Acidobacteria bacterium]|nr:Uma2 family endonuclease [Acidobacteriota bacterium]
MSILTEVSQIDFDPDRRYEIVAGHPEEKEMPGARHGAICSRINSRLEAHIESHHLGVVFIETNFKIGENERIPDIAFVTADHIPPEGIPESSWQTPPDLAIEVISPTDLHEKVNTKILEYLNAGVRQVWIVSPENQSITIFRSQTDVQVFAGDVDLVCEDLLPGFRCHPKDLFPTITER